MKNHLPTHPATVLALAFLATIVLGTALLMLPWASGESAPWLTALQQLSVTDFSHMVVSIGANLEASGWRTS